MRFLLVKIGERFGWDFMRPRPAFGLQAPRKNLSMVEARPGGRERETHFPASPKLQLEATSRYAHARAISASAERPKHQRQTPETSKLSIPAKWLGVTAGRATTLIIPSARRSRPRTIKPELAVQPAAGRVTVCSNRAHIAASGQSRHQVIKTAGHWNGKSHHA
jgi:hypothetical protein